MTRLRLGLALAGFGAALLAIAFEERRLGWVAIGCLAVSFLIRLGQSRSRPS